MLAASLFTIKSRIYNSQITKLHVSSTQGESEIRNLGTFVSHRASMTGKHVLNYLKDGHPLMLRIKVTYENCPPVSQTRCWASSYARVKLTVLRIEIKMDNVEAWR